MYKKSSHCEKALPFGETDQSRFATSCSSLLNLKSPWMERYIPDAPTNAANCPGRIFKLSATL
jgi:hypothetical protein